MAASMTVYKIVSVPTNSPTLTSVPAVPETMTVVVACVAGLRICPVR